MKYKGYNAVVDFCEDAKVFRGEVIDLRDVITFESDRAEALEAEFRKSVDEYLAFCEEIDREPERSFSGRFVLRTSTDLHHDLAVAAKESHVSLNEYCVQELSKLIHQ
jgi:predicted HicB family RNase H-like nuclease